MFRTDSQRVTSKKPPVLIRIREDLKSALERAAVNQNRSLSNLFETVLDQWARENGYLPKQEKK